MPFSVADAHDGGEIKEEEDPAQRASEKPTHKISDLNSGSRSGRKADASGRSASRSKGGGSLP